MRGEDVWHRLPNVPVGGSPPHARGRRQPNRVPALTTWITPACAGKTRKTPVPIGPGLDHPRMRGEDIRTCRRRPTTHGSPPHARGRPRSSQGKTSPPGITPACAGKTSPNFCMTSRYEDHPRMRGEDWKRDRLIYGRGGSPPHARGRHRRIKMPRPPRRITPACAGKTGSFLWKTFTWPDHPRMRGEDSFLALGWVEDCGSPPHARGRREDRAPRARRRGITPACAGKTKACHAFLVRVGGSPPHARGRHLEAWSLNHSERITPACAGKTSTSASETNSSPDHPRMRGEDKLGQEPCPRPRGSPPHARGRRPDRRGSP